MASAFTHTTANSQLVTEKIDFKKEMIMNMIDKFIRVRRISLDQLARQLNIDSKSLSDIYKAKKYTQQKINKIALPLIRLYCKTRW